MDRLKKAKVVVLASGRGSNFEALIQAGAQGKLPRVALTALICNIPSAHAITIAEKHHIPCFVIPSEHRNKSWDRSIYEERLLKQLLDLKPDWICLAGYMLLLGPAIVRKFNRQIMNIHPSLLPKFPGLNAQRQALEAREKETGCTVHWVTEGLDEGPVIVQKSLPILANDTEDSLSGRLLELEHRTYVEALQLVTESPSHLNYDPK